MPAQSGRNIAVSYAAETTFGTAPAQAAAAKYLRVNGGGTSLTKEAIRSNEVRRDGQMTRGRHGSRSVTGSYPIDLSLGAADDLLQAAMRGAFDAGLTISGLSLTSSSAQNRWTRTTGSFLTDGFRVGDVIRATGWTTTVANNNKNLRVTAVTATTLTFAEPQPNAGTAETGITITRPKKLLNGTTARSFSFEENELDIVGSMLFKGVRIGGWSLSLSPNGMVVVTFTLVGQDMEVKPAGQSPYFTAPTTTVAVAMTVVEAVIRLGATDVLDITSMELAMNLNASGVPVVGSNITPDVFTNPADPTGTITAMKSDVSRVQSFLTEEQLSLHLVCADLTTAPAGFCSFFAGNVTLGSATPAEIGGDNARTQTLALMIGADDRGGAFDPTTFKYQTSAP